MKCHEETKTITTSCKHHHCLLCAAEELNSSDHNFCPQCGKKVTAMHMENIGEDGKRELSVFTAIGCTVYIVMCMLCVQEVVLLKMKKFLAQSGHAQRISLVFWNGNLNIGWL